MIIHMRKTLFPKTNTQAGLSILEVIVVLAIIGVLAGVIFLNVSSARQKSKIAKAEADLRLLRDAIALLESDTGKWPNGCPVDQTNTPTTDLDTPEAGILTQPPVGVISMPCEWTQEEVDSWKGQYSDHTKDPWLRSYVFDPDYVTHCDAGSPVHRPVILSYAEDGASTEPFDASCNPQTTDDIYLILQ